MLPNSTNLHVIEIHEKLAALYDKLVDMEQPHNPGLRVVDARNAAQA